MTHDSAREVIATALPVGEKLYAVADTILDALQSAGYAVVPVEPTEAMVEAGRKAMSPEKFVSHARAIWVWLDMVAAARAMLTASDSGQEKGK